MSKKVFDPTETVEEKRIRMINQRDKQIASLRKTIRKLREQKNKQERKDKMEREERSASLEEHGFSMVLDQPDEHCDTCGKLGAKFVHISFFAKKQIIKECEICGQKTLNSKFKHGVNWKVFK